MPIELCVFLGNPGAEYVHNRHNAGRLLAGRGGLSWQKKFKGLFAVMREQAASGTRYALEPETYMNRSGDSVAAAAAFYKIAPENIIVIHDELELELGQASLKFSGGLNGHNGLRSIKAALGSADFWRLRIGIGRPAGNASADISGWVLSDFSAAELPLLEETLTACDAALQEALRSGPENLLPAWKKINVETLTKRAENFPLRERERR